MPYGYEKTWTCLPITSLAYISQPQQDLLLSGQGPILKAEFVTSQGIFAQEQAFEFQSIHGIKTQDASEDQGQVGSISLLIWGGQRLALGRISFSSTGSIGQFSLSSLAIGPEFEAADWILDASFATPTHLPAIAYFVTAHNDVFALRLDSSCDLGVTISKVASGPSSILYSARIKPISTINILVAAGTVFGEVIVWSCYRSTYEIPEFGKNWQSRTSNVFHGHNGSIFGVCISDSMDVVGDHQPRRLIASCSDDRTIRVWDVSDCHDAPKSGLNVSGQPHGDVPQTGFGGIANASVATSWGHSSRIWGVDFIHPDGGSSAGSLRLISRGEDATSQVLELTWEEPRASTERADHRNRGSKLTQASTDHFHSGKHIWSHAHHQMNSSAVIFTGGGDGRIITRLVPTQAAGVSCLSIQTPFCDLFKTIRPGLAKDSFKTENDSIKQYVFVSDDAILATTNYGHVIKGTIKINEQISCRSLSINWTLLYAATEHGAITVMTSDTRESVVYLGSATGSIWIYQHALPSIQLLATIDQKISTIFTGTVSTHGNDSAFWHLLVCSTISLSAKLLQITQLSREFTILCISKTVELSLPSTFQPTAFLQISDGNLLVLGSRSGALAIYHNFSCQSGIGDQIAPSLCVRHIHGCDSVIHLQHLTRVQGSKQDTSYHDVLSTGRDGSYAIHRIVSQDCGGRVGTPIVTTLHRSRPPFGPNIEGASISMTSSSTTQLLLHGFDGKIFVVWNESTNSEVMSVPCGGAHRSWAYSSNALGGQLGTIRQRRCLVWTKAGAFNLAMVSSPAHQIIQPGGHGREIKAMALFQGAVSPNVPHHPVPQLIATGAEDTAIRLWTVIKSGEHVDVERQHAGSKDSASCVRILKKHTTGIQHLSFCKNFLFSSAGCEELFIWKINFGVSVVNIGTIFQAALPKTAPASDLRITSFEAICVPGGQKDDSTSEIGHFYIYAAYSNSMIRIFKYTDDDILAPGERFQLLGEGFYNTTCLTKIRGLLECFSWFLAGSTNGAVTVWPGLNDQVDPQDSPAVLSQTAEHFIHQNAILALHITRIAPGYHLLLTGGDDNAFGITLMFESASESTLCKTSDNGNSLPTPRFRTLLIPRAHAAAITALEILDSRKEASLTILTVVSTGNDQRLKVWRITVNVDELPKIDHYAGMSTDEFGPEVLDVIDVQPVNEMWTSVADASSMIVISDAEAIDTAGDVGLGEGVSGRGKRLMVAGIGMEMIRIDWASESDRSREGETSDA